MKKLITLSFFLILGTSMFAQETIEELKAQKAALQTELAPVKAQADDLKGKIGSLNDRITKLSGWQTALFVNLGFDFNKSDNWAANTNPVSSSSSLGLGVTASANKITDGYFWRNKGIWNKAWQDVDIPGTETKDDNLFDDGGTVDLLNISSLYGYKITKTLALSALGELNTSLGNFLEPGTVDIGVGLTWTPIQDLVVVVHPLNYRVAFNGIEGASSEGGIGAKLRADYGRSFNIGGNSIAWSSTFTSFLPYQGAEEGIESLQEFTWLNGLSFNVFKGIGVGINFGIRQADFETTESQNFYSVGMNYGFSR